MNLILNIDTAVETASVCLAKEGESINFSINEDPKAQASWLHQAIAGIFQNTGFGMQDLKAVAVSIGPGSYTGLRIGLSAAKGLCFALNIPLISIGTLDMMAFAAKDEEADLVCPMIDARRMEVFTALYNKRSEHVIPPQAMTITENSFSKFLSNHKIIFLGNGSKKLQTIISGNNAEFSSVQATAVHLASLSNIEFKKNHFADLAYVEPQYLKDFYTLPNPFAQKSSY